MTTTTKPSEGAVRAGRNISDHFRRALPNLPESNAHTLAEIIDRETHAGEMLEALEQIVGDQLWQLSRDGSDFAYKVRNIAREAIRRARGGA